MKCVDVDFRSHLEVMNDRAQLLEMVARETRGNAVCGAIRGDNDFET